MLNEKLNQYEPIKAEFGGLFALESTFSVGSIVTLPSTAYSMSSKNCKMSQAANVTCPPDEFKYKSTAASNQPNYLSLQLFDCPYLQKCSRDPNSAGCAQLYKANLDDFKLITCASDESRKETLANALITLRYENRFM